MNGTFSFLLVFGSSTRVYPLLSLNLCLIPLLLLQPPLPGPLGYLKNLGAFPPPFRDCCRSKQLVDTFFLRARGCPFSCRRHPFRSISLSLPSFCCAVVFGCSVWRPKELSDSPLATSFGSRTSLLARGILVRELVARSREVIACDVIVFLDTEVLFPDKSSPLQKNSPKFFLHNTNLFPPFPPPFYTRFFRAVACLTLSK